ncbi:MAG TPA: 2-hydroxyacid dehydrogenase [Nocardioides sp.]
MPATRPAPRMVTLPFPVSRLQQVPASLDYRMFAGDEDPAVLAETDFWVPPYDVKLDYPSILAGLSRLQVVQAQFAGVDHLAEWMPDGATLCNARGVHDAATAEMGMTLILASLRQLPDFVLAQAEQRWAANNSAESLADKTVVIVGFGSIGQALARRLEGFECEVIGVTRSGRDGSRPTTELPTLLPTADVVVILTPLTDETRHLVDAPFLAAMRDSALLVNLARGAVVDTAALLAEVQSGRLHAALDVTDPEPLPPDHPLWGLPTVLITPHAAGGSSAMQPRIDRLIEAQLARFAAGLPLLNVVQQG